MCTAWFFCCRFILFVIITYNLFWFHFCEYNKKRVSLVIKDYKSFIILPWSDICHPFLCLSFLSPNWMCECVQMQIEPRSMAWMSLFQPTPVTLTTARCLSWCSASLWTTDSMTPTLAWWGKASYQCSRDCLRLCRTSPILKINVALYISANYEYCIVYCILILILFQCYIVAMLCLGLGGKTTWVRKR